MCNVLEAAAWGCNQETLKYLVKKEPGILQDCKTLGYLILCCWFTPAENDPDDGTKIYGSDEEKIACFRILVDAGVDLKKHDK